MPESPQLLAWFRQVAPEPIGFIEGVLQINSEQFDEWQSCDCAAYWIADILLSEERNVTMLNVDQATIEAISSVHESWFLGSSEWIDDVGVYLPTPVPSPERPG